MLKLCITLSVILGALPLVADPIKGVSTYKIATLESSQGRHMVSPAGAVGWHGFMPKTWATVTSRMGHGVNGPKGHWPLSLSRHRGVSTQVCDYYVNVIIPKELGRRRDTLENRLKVYNCGHIGRVPRETRNYIKRYKKL